MPRPLRIEISESEDTLKRLLRQQSSGRRKERLQALYWLKSGQVTTRMELRCTHKSVLSYFPCKEHRLKPFQAMC